MRREECTRGHVGWQAVLGARQAWCNTARRGRLWAGLLILLVAGSLATGQQVPLDRNAVVRRPQPFDAKGRVHSVAPGLIRMVTDTQQPWLVQLDRRTQIQVRGTGGVELIAPGVFVRFEAPLIGRRIAAGEITEMALFNPVEGFRAGVMEDPGPAGDEQLNLTGDPSDQADRTERGRSRRTSGQGRKRAQGAAQGHYLIAGQVRSFRKGHLVVLAGKGGTIKATVDPKAKVTIDTTSCSMVRSGDTIHVTGSYAQPGRVLARKVEIELAPREPPADRSGRRSRQRRPPTDPPAEGPQRDGPMQGPDRNGSEPERDRPPG